MKNAICTFKQLQSDVYDHSRRSYIKVQQNMFNSLTGKLQINIIKIIIIFFKDLTNKQDFILKFVNMVS